MTTTSTLRTSSTTSRSPGRSAVLTAALIALLAFVMAPSGAGAATGTVVVSPGLETTGATITAADGTTSPVTAEQSASMMQPLLAAMYYGSPQFVEPPATAVRSTIAFEYVFTVDEPAVTGTMTVNYAQQGSTGWVSFKAQALWPGSAIPAELDGKWFVISPAFVAGFNGQGTVRTFPVDDGSSTKSSSSSINGGVIVGVIVIAVVVLGGVLAVRRRRSAPRS